MSLKIKHKNPKLDLMVIGWIEHIALPALGLGDIRCKIDTGARTSALHADNITKFQKDGEDWVRCDVRLKAAGKLTQIEAPIYDMRKIKNTGGVPQERIVIRTPVVLGGRKWSISVSLTDRSNMKFPMIVGRSALKNQNIAVHTRLANLTRT